MKKQGELLPSLGLFSTIILVISSIIGSGIYKKIAPMSAELLSPQLVLLCWVVAGLMSLFGALSNAEVASLLANSGGEYSYYRKIYNQFFGFLYGWSNFFVIRTGSFASIAYVFAMSLSSIIAMPKVSEELASVTFLGVFQPFDNLGVKLIAIALVWLLTGINYRGLSLGKMLSNFSMSAVLISITLIIVLGLTASNGTWANLQINAAGYVPKSFTDPVLIQAFFAASLAAFWGYEGWATVGYMGSEVKNPQRNLPIAIIGGILLVIVLYLSIHTIYLYILPIDQFVAIHKAKNSIAAVEVVRAFLGNGGALFISLLILLTTFNCTHSTMLMASRLYYTMAKDGLFFKAVNFIHPKFNSPSKSLVYQSIWATVLIFSGSFDQLTDMLIFASFFFYGATTLGVYILRKTMPDAPRSYKVIGYPIVPAIFILFCIALIAITMWTKPREAFIGIGLMATGIPFYFYWKNQGRIGE
jgi:basic amino acid/polyamine antiporter, APA family